MGARKEITTLLLVDALAIGMAWYSYYLIRVSSGWLGIAVSPDFWLPLIAVCLFWMLVFFVVGLYRAWYAASRFDELTLVFKTITMGCLFLFFAVFFDDQGSNVAVSSRILIAMYWGVMLAWVSAGRMVIRTVQRRMLIAGIGVHPTIIVGSAAKSRELYDEVARFPALGYKVLGFAGLDKRRSGQDYKGIPVLGSLDELHDIIAEKKIQEVLIALDSSDHDRLLDIIGRCNSHKVNLKIIPDLYDIISGQARTNQIYAFPLIEIMPQIMTPWEEAVKRIIDFSVAVIVLFVGLPVWILVAFLIKLESRGPVLYKQERVGKKGEVFSIVKFRSMRQDAEKAGPQWAGKKDPRVTRVGKWIRKLHIDEVPQTVNVLKGEMSLVGPRPERPVFVEELSKEIPLYKRRLNVRPGVTGWAQVKLRYDETIEDVRKKVEYDLYYIENMSLRMDFKIMVSTVSHMLMWKGR